jgi:hypothetical protein
MQPAGRANGNRATATVRFKMKYETSTTKPPQRATTASNTALHVAARLVRHARRLILRIPETWP